MVSSTVKGSIEGPFLKWWKNMKEHKIVLQCFMSLEHRIWNARQARVKKMFVFLTILSPKSQKSSSMQPQSSRSFALSLNILWILSNHIVQAIACTELCHRCLIRRQELYFEVDAFDFDNSVKMLLCERYCECDFFFKCPDSGFTQGVCCFPTIFCWYV